MQTALYLAGGGVLLLLALRHGVRWWRARLDVDPVSETWLAHRRGMPTDE